VLDVFFAIAIVGLVVVFGRQRLDTFEASADLALLDGDDDDLPCPWCNSPTHERDHRCPNCYRRFG